MRGPIDMSANTLYNLKYLLSDDPNGISIISLNDINITSGSNVHITNSESIISNTTMSFVSYQTTGYSPCAGSGSGSGSGATYPNRRDRSGGSC